MTYPDHKEDKVQIDLLEETNFQAAESLRTLAGTCPSCGGAVKKHEGIGTTPDGDTYDGVMFYCDACGENLTEEFT